MALLIETNLPEWMTNEVLKAQLQPLLPDVDIRYAPNLGDLSEVVMVACVWLPAGWARMLPNLRLVQKLGAGVEAIVDDPDLPPNVQVTRLKPDIPAQEMAEYCLAHVLWQQRNMYRHIQDQAIKKWDPIPPRKTAETTIGILGLGHIGGQIASLFAQLGFRVLGWSRSAKLIEGVDCRFGADALYPLLGECDYVASVLPSTAQTRNLFNRSTFAAMKTGATLINVGRGDLIVDNDLLNALNNGHLGRAVLDVFHAEPLSREHPFWSHPQITITPHVSGWHVDNSFTTIAENYRRLIDGRTPINLVNRERGY